MDPTYRAYNTHVPSYLQGCPRNVIIHCLVREEKAKKNSHLKTVDFGTQAGKPNCTCQDWAKNNLPCKHFFLIFITTDEWGWSSLPRSYLNGPYLCRDGVSLNKTTSTCAAPIESQEECVVHDNLQDEIPLKVRVLTT